MNEALDFPLPPTTGPHLAAPPTTPTAAAPISVPAPVSAPDPVPVPAPVLAPEPPAVDELTALRDKVAELDSVIALAKTRVETLGAEKREALERAIQLEAQLEAVQQREAELLARLASHESPRTSVDDQTVAELLNRVAALEALMSPSRAA
jgi:hypothetical protein